MFIILTSFAQDEAIRKSALGLNFNELTVSSGGACTSKSFIGLSCVPRPREFVVEELPNAKPDVPLKAVFVEPNMFANYRCSVSDFCIFICKIYETA